MIAAGSFAHGDDVMAQTATPFPSLPVLEFSEADIEACIARAKRLKGAKHRAGLSRRQANQTHIGPDDSDSWVPHLWAVKATVAAARVIGGSIDPYIGVTGNKDGDLISPSGRRGFARYSRVQYADLALYGETMALFRGAFAVLVWPVDHQDTSGWSAELAYGPVIVGGWCDRQRFERLSLICSYGSGDRLALPWRMLEHPDSFREWDVAA